MGRGRMGGEGEEDEVWGEEGEGREEEDEVEESETG